MSKAYVEEIQCCGECPHAEVNKCGLTNTMFVESLVHEKEHFPKDCPLNDY